MSILYDNAGNPVSEDNPLPIKSMASSIIQPIDVQSHLQQTIQTHNAVSVGANSVSFGSWIDTDGFTDISLLLISDAATTNGAYLQWSVDGSASQGDETSWLIPSNTQQRKANLTQTKGRYARVALSNGDTVAHTMSAWIYLKA